MVIMPPRVYFARTDGQTGGQLDYIMPTAADQRRAEKSIDVRFWRLKSVPALKDLKYRNTNVIDIRTLVIKLLINLPLSLGTLASATRIWWLEWSIRALTPRSHSHQDAFMWISCKWGTSTFRHCDHLLNPCQGHRENRLLQCHKS